MALELGPRPSEPQRTAYEKAARVADLLLAHGLPVVGFSDFDFGSKIGFALQMTPGVRVGVRFPVETAPELIEGVLKARLDTFTAGHGAP